MTITCFSCGEPCTGEVLKAQDRHFHVSCFVCKVCNRLLSSGGYFMKNDVYYCSKDYHTLFGTKCLTCGEYVEGRVVTALGKSYHPHCFTCDRCKEVITSGTVVTYNDRQQILCQKCTDFALDEVDNGQQQPGSVRGSKSVERESTATRDGFSKAGSYPTTRDPPPSSSSKEDLFDFTKVPDVDPLTRSRMGRCAGCGEPIRTTQSLLALDRHWHLFCFFCSHCRKLLTSEYMNKGEQPYCEPCYHKLYGAACDVCNKYITGKVLEAGDKHYHPGCASCCKCNLVFLEGEDMCIAGEDIWHLDCERAREVAGVRTDSETSSECSRSQTRSTPSPVDHSRPQSRHSSSKLGTLSRESSSGEPKRDLKTYPLKELQLNGVHRLPRDVNRTKLEQHLSDEDFHAVFQMDRSTFYSLQSWKQIDMKKCTCRCPCYNSKHPSVQTIKLQRWYLRWQPLGMHHLLWSAPLQQYPCTSPFWGMVRF